MYVDLDATLTVKAAAQWFTVLRGTTVTKHVVYGWVSRYQLVKNGAGYRYGDLLKAEARARGNDVGAGRGRPKAA